MHKDKRAKITGTGGAGKAMVMGLLDRHTSRVRLVHVPNVQGATLQTHVRKYVKGGSYVFTDAWAGYHGLDREYVHKVIDHAETYVKGNVHTNKIENFWSLLKRGLKGTYVSVEPFHLFRYLDEQAYRFSDTQRNRWRALRRRCSFCSRSPADLYGAHWKGHSRPRTLTSVNSGEADDGMLSCRL
jgi:transposase-like protein